MADFNTKYIFPGDNKNEILDKINFNFFQVLSNAVGEKGPIGDVGPTGLRGQAGRDGQPGITGDRAANWYFSAVEPSSAVSQENDVWVNTGTTGGQEIYFYSSGSWVSSGQSLSSSGQFSTLIGASGPGGASDSNAIYINGTPSDKTLVLSDATGTTGNINPNLAKLLISTDAATTAEFPNLSFAKTFLPQTPGGIVSFKWRTAGSNYSNEWILPGNSTLQSGTQSVYSGTGGVVLQSSGNMFLTSQSFLNFTGATGTSGAFSLSTTNNLNLTSSNVNVSGSVATVTLSSGGTAYIQASSNASVPLVDLQSQASGVYIEADSSTTDQMLKILDKNDYPIISAGRQNKFTWGSAGSTGYHQAKGVTLTQPSTFPTFTRSTFTNNYLDAGSPTNDMCIITPTYSGPSQADGKTNRVYLSVGSNYSWATGIVGGDQSRTFDFFLNSSTYSFGGIRVVTTGASSVNTAQINDAGTGITGCQHIRLTFFGNSTIANLHYQAFSLNNYSCGWITYTVSELAPGGGPTLDPGFA